MRRNWWSGGEFGIPINLMSADICLARAEQAKAKRAVVIPTGRYELELADVTYAYWDSPDVIEGKHTFVPSLCVE